MKNCKNIAGIGVSQHMEEHLLPSLGLVPGLRLRKLASRNPERRNELNYRYGVEVVEDWNSLIDDVNIQAVIVAGPPEFNQTVAQTCMNAGKPMFVEKPVGLNLKNVLQLAEIEKDRNSLVQVGYNFRFSTICENLFGLKANFGEIKELAIEFHANKPREPFWGLGSTFEALLYAVAIHPLELMSSNLSEQEDFRFWRSSTPGGGESFVAVASDERTTITLKSSNISPHFRFGLEALFEDGTRAKVDHASPTKIIWTSDSLDVPAAGNPSTLWKKIEFSSTFREQDRDRESSGYQAELIEFREALCGMKPSVAPLRSSIRPHRWIDHMLNHSLES